MYDRIKLQDLEKFYRKQLLEDTVPFWFPRSIDNEYGGFFADARCGWIAV